MLSMCARFLSAISLLTLFGCSDAAAPSGQTSLLPRDSGGFSRYNEAYRFATHNSYWVDRGTSGDAFASGVGERLLDQLLFDHARGIEIDIHRSDETAHDFRVYHTVPGNSLCDTLGECLGVLRAFHRALPQHEVVTIVLELKEVTASNFDSTHTIDDLDKVLRDELGDLLYQPKDLFAPCIGHGVKNLSSCVENTLWPGLGELRGKFVVAILGNWDAVGARATRDWVDYATPADINSRAAFPMASSWKLEIGQVPPLVAELLTQSEIDDAFAQSVFLQIEDKADSRITPFLRRQGVIRIDNAFDLDAQAQVITAGMQLVQSDTPWIQANDRGMKEPLRPLLANVADIVEPGERLVLASGNSGDRTFAFVKEQAASKTTWETTISSGVDVSSVGCIRAADKLGDINKPSSISVCRRKLSGQVDMSQGGAKGTLDAERVFIDVEVCDQGACMMTSMGSEEPSAGGIGDTVSVAIDSHDSGMSCVTVQSARIAERDLSLRWANVGQTFCVNAPLTYQGLARPTSAKENGKIGFFGTTRSEGNAPSVSIRGQTFAGVVVESPGQTETNGETLLEDVSTP